jgi:hypothetical protein
VASGATVLSGRGYAVPREAGAQLAAVLKLSASQRVEIPVFGDSTTFGAGGGYSWLQRLRDRLVTAGMTNGGKGLFGFNETQIVYDAPEVNGFVSRSGFGVVADGSGVYAFNAEDYVSVTAGETVTLQGRGQEVEILYTKRTATGEFTYAVDGGAATTVSAVGGSGAAGRIKLSLGGVRDALHTVTIVNRGGVTPGAPTITAASQNGPGTNTGPVSFSAGNYYYKAAFVYASGYTVASAATTLADSGGARSHSIQLNSTGQSSVRLYRSLSPAGPFERVTTITQDYDNGSLVGITDAGSNVDTADLAPTVGTVTGVTGSATQTAVAVGFKNTVGVVLQKFARTGATISEWFDPVGYKTSAGTYNWKPQHALGLVQDAAPVATPPFGWAAVQASTAAPHYAPRPAAAILHLGFNDMSDFPLRWVSSVAYTTNQKVGFGGGFWYAVAGSTNVKPGTDATKWLPLEVGGGYPLDMLTEGIQLFCRLARSAGAVPIVCAGQYPLNSKALEYGGAVAAAVRAAALAQGAIWLDHMEGRGAPNQWNANGVTSSGDPHLSVAGYKRQADFAADNVFIPLLTS